MLNNLMERLRANPLALGLVGAGAVLGLGGLGWLAREVTARSETASRPSLLQLLEQVTQPATTPRQPQPRRPAPLPPPRPAWVSPLGRECLDRDPRLRQRLEAELAALPARRQRIPIDPSNYGVRFERDAFGHAIDPTPQVVVLHETVYGVGSALRTFQTPHPRDEDQVSYHTLIGGDGQVIDVLDPEQRAFGAGNSAFNGRWVVTNPRVGGSVNNFALHISLETPSTGKTTTLATAGTARGNMTPWPWCSLTGCGASRFLRLTSPPTVRWISAVSGRIRAASTGRPSKEDSGPSLSSAEDGAEG